jgi:hypothetical protein
MKVDNSYKKFFGEIPIFGMIHLNGTFPVRRALDELSIFEAEGVNGAIIENYFGSVKDVEDTLREVKKIKPNLFIGVNILPNEFNHSFYLAEKYGADFIQLDHVAGNYDHGTLNFEEYAQARHDYSKIFVLGGVWPKYYAPLLGSSLEKDLLEGVNRADAIVVTGEGTGKVTPIGKIQKFREIMRDYPLVIGAGLNLDNLYEQLPLSNGAIVGSSLKIEGKDYNNLDIYRAKDFMSAVKEVRAQNRG